jgi:hypothetical protein
MPPFIHVHLTSVIQWRIYFEASLHVHLFPTSPYQIVMRCREESMNDTHTHTHIVTKMLMQMLHSISINKHSDVHGYLKCRNVIQK